MRHRGEIELNPVERTVGLPDDAAIGRARRQDDVAALSVARLENRAIDRNRVARLGNADQELASAIASVAAAIAPQPSWRSQITAGLGPGARLRTRPPTDCRPAACDRCS